MTLIYMVSSLYNHDKLKAKLEKENKDFIIEIREHISEDGVIVVNEKRQIQDFFDLD